MRVLKYAVPALVLVALARIGLRQERLIRASEQQRAETDAAQQAVAALRAEFQTLLDVATRSLDGQTATVLELRGAVETLSATVAQSRGSAERDGRVLREHLVDVRAQLEKDLDLRLADGLAPLESLRASLLRLERAEGEIRQAQRLDRGRIDALRDRIRAIVEKLGR